MSNKEKKMEIIKALVTIVKDRYKKHIESQAALEAEQTRQRVYDTRAKSKWEEDSIGFGPQPPNVSLYRNKEFDARAEFQKWESVYYYALENLVGED